MAIQIQNYPVVHYKSRPTLMHNAHDEPSFLRFATKYGMVGIKGHRTMGGFCASLYNALPYESVQALVACMKEYTVIEHASTQPSY